MNDRARSNMLFGLLVCAVTVLVAVAVSVLSYRGVTGAAGGAFPATDVPTPPKAVRPSPTLMAVVPEETSSTAEATRIVASPTPMPSATSRATLASTASPTVASPAPTATSAAVVEAPTIAPSATGEVPPDTPTATTESTAAGVSDAPTEPPEVVATMTAAATLAAEQEALVRRIAQMEQDLKSGSLVATAQLAGGARSTVSVQFTYGDAQNDPAIHITTTYTGTGNAQTSEYTEQGNRSWERRGGEEWREVPPGEGPAHQLLAYLPHIASAEYLAFAQGDDTTAIRWYSAAYDAETTLIVDAKTLIPLHTQRVGHSTGQTLSVDYIGWNTPVTIEAPGGG